MRQLVYFSTAADRQDAIVVAGIVVTSRENNLRNGVTGLLVAGGHRYLQVIEGSSGAIGDLVKSLRRDDRHVGMTVLIDRTVDERNFTGWSMAFREEPRLDQFSTFGELVAEMRRNLPERKLRDQLDCFAQTFAIPSLRVDSPLWTSSREAVAP